MGMTEQVEKLLAGLREEAEEAEALAGNARESLARLTSGITPLEELDTRQLLTTADTLSEQLHRLAAIQAIRSCLRKLLT